MRPLPVLSVVLLLACGLGIFLANERDGKAAGERPSTGPRDATGSLEDRKNESPSRQTGRQLRTKEAEGLLAALRETSRTDGSLDGYNKLLRTWLKTHDVQPAEFRLLVQGMLDMPGVGKTFCLSIVFSKMGKTFPKEALGLCEELSGREGARVSVPLLAQWTLDQAAVSDPQLALDWLKNHPEVFPGREYQDACCVFLQATVKIDPARAFSLLGELPLDDRAAAARSIGSIGGGPEERTKILEALNEAALSDPAGAAALRKSVLEGLGSTLAGQSSRVDLTLHNNAMNEQNRAWAGSAAFTDEDRRILASGLTTLSSTPDAGKWLEWVSDQVGSSDPGPEQIGKLMRSWIRDEPGSAEQWLFETQNLAARDGSIPAFVEKEARRDPEKAMKAAMLLPEGPAREALVASIAEIQKSNPKPGTGG